MDRWIGKVAIVTGASSGIGAAIAKKLTQEGMVVVGLARRLDRMDELKSEVQNEKGTFYPVQCDVSKESDVLAAFEEAKKLGPIHVLVNNAGTLKSANLTELSTEDLERTIGVNLFGLCIATREAVKDMKTNNVDGHILHMSSTTGHDHIRAPIINLYPATKHAVSELAKTLRDEFTESKRKIKVTSISPGIVQTEIFAKSGLSFDPKEVEMPTLFPEDIANAVVYVLSTPPHVDITELTIRPVNDAN